MKSEYLLDLSIVDNRLKIRLKEPIDDYSLFTYGDNKNITGRLIIDDNRHISSEQRRKIYALIYDLCMYTGDDYQGYGCEQWKFYFKQEVMNIFNVKEFSLSDCSVTVANYMILTILNFMFDEDIPFRTKTWDSIPTEFPKQMLAIKHKRCVLCGKPADIAHVRAVGAGRNRNKISHVGNYIMTLCRKHHKEQHDRGIKDFANKYHIRPIKVTPEIAKQLHLGKVEKNGQ